MAQRVEAPDSSEIDALESLVISEGWGLVAERVDMEISCKRDELERNASLDEQNRGFLAACRMFLELPKMLTDEIKQQIGDK